MPPPPRSPAPSPKSWVSLKPPAVGLVSVEDILKKQCLRKPPLKPPTLSLWCTALARRWTRVASSGTPAYTVDSITPDKVRGIRDMLNSSAMDIMYYTSPLYRDEITRGLTQELNRLYSLFCSRNPDFEKNGKVSIVAHSLGCVITFDIMTGWDPVRFHHQQMLDPEKAKIRWPSEEERHLQEQIGLLRLRLRDLEDQFRGLQTPSSVAVPALKFKVENFFCMGSPLAVFLALRGIRPGNNTMQDHILSTSICKRLFNLFHPTDPVAYRLEPLILKHYSNISPVQIDWYNTTSPSLYDQIRPTRLNLTKDTSFVSESEILTSPCTSPPQTRRPYGESITSLGKASIMGAASIGKGIGGILFSPLFPLQRPGWGCGGGAIRLGGRSL
ncbi:Phospholipase DDHD1 [Oryzias melastigma]|uniref:Phospholipase DDHD1 n=1 Tax=Oryzias melastigma TaxID=30732 RepID=A0A834CK21_ORYME|nr:Phospholipase DDHD1 [Oryzias melastigma]